MPWSNVGKVIVHKTLSQFLPILAFAVNVKMFTSERGLASAPLAIPSHIGHAQH